MFALRIFEKILLYCLLINIFSAASYFYLNFPSANPINEGLKNELDEIEVSLFNNFNEIMIKDFLQKLYELQIK